MKKSKHQHDRFTAIAAIALGAAAAGLFVAPEETTARVRTVVRDAVFPGHRAIVEIEQAVQPFLDKFQPVGASETELAELRAQIEKQELLCRQLKLEVAAANARVQTIQREGVSPFVASKASPLVVPELVEATILGENAAASFRSLQLIDRGQAAGVIESDLVLKSDAPILDQGQDAGLAPDQPIYAGRIVIGKVRDAGRWTSTVESVCDISFRGHAQIIWQSPDGAVFGAEGILEGRGDGTCRLSNVAATAAVSVGDEVYTARQASSLPCPMFYGVVVEADLQPGALFWDVVVKPAAAELNLETVQVLSTRRNPSRPLAN